jgi:predicted dehydrogenase
LKALVIGYGSIGKRHIQNLFKINNMDILVITKRKNDDFLKKYNCKIFPTIQNAINEKPTFAIICTETNTHVKYATILAKYGIHLFIEKPLSNSIFGVNSLLRISKNKNLITLVGCNFRFHPCIKKIKNVLSTKKLGKILNIQIENGSYLPDWHPNENYTKSYAAQENLGGGVVLTCIHEIDYLYWFFGKISEVFAITGKFSDLKINAEDLSTILMKVGNNSIAELHLDYFQQPSQRSCKIIGTKGTLVWNFKFNSVNFYNNKSKKWSYLLKLTKYNHNHMYIDELTHFINCIKMKKTTINSISEGVKTLKIALAIKKASKTKMMEKP